MTSAKSTLRRCGADSGLSAKAWEAFPGWAPWAVSALVILADSEPSAVFAIAEVSLR